MSELRTLPQVEPPDAAGSARATPGSATEYRCPGEGYAISRAVHLARLATFYDKCNGCPLAHDDGALLPVSRRRQLAARPPRPEFAELFDTTGVRGTFGRELTPRVARRIALAFGVHLRDLGVRPDEACCLATDGGLLTPEIVAAASEALRWCGLSVVDVGATTAPALVATQLARDSAASLYIGQSRQPAHQVTVQFWGPDARPWSLPGSLGQVRQLAAAPLDRPTRHGGSTSRDGIAPGYLERLGSHYHALRPLRIVLETACTPWRKQFAELLAQVRCELIDAAEQVDAEQGGVARLPGMSKEAELASPAAQAPCPAAPLPPALPCSRLALRVVECQAHLGIAIGDDGQSLAIVDDYGSVIENARLAAALAEAAGGQAHVDSALPPERFYADMRTTGAGVGVSAAARVWFADRDPPVADPLAAVAALLVLLSQSDRPVSAVFG
ncbi:MAG: hypothetical protein AB7U73_00095 [Pirellulales bacterium]